MVCVFFFNYSATTEIYTYCHSLSLPDALPISWSVIDEEPVRVSSRAQLGNVLGRRRARISAGRRVSFGTYFNGTRRSEEHTSELQSLMRISYAVFCLKKKN